MEHRTDTAERSWRIPVAVTVGAALTLAGVFAPWLRSGTSSRSSFELFDLVDRLGFTPGGAFEWAVRLWPLVPLVTIGAVVASWTGRTRLAVGLSGTAGCYVGAVAVGLRAAPNAGLIRTDWGVNLALVGAITLVATAVWTLVDVSRSTGRARRRPV